MLWIWLGKTVPLFIGAGLLVSVARDEVRNDERWNRAGTICLAVAVLVVGFHGLWNLYQTTSFIAGLDPATVKQVVLGYEPLEPEKGREFVRALAASKPTGLGTTEDHVPMELTLPQGKFYGDVHYYPRGAVVILGNPGCRVWVEGLEPLH